MAIRPLGNIDLWKECLKLFTDLAGTLAPFQSPRLATIEVNNNETQRHEHPHLDVRGTEGLTTLLRERGIPVDKLLTTVTLKPIKGGRDGDEED